jgi:hypothetical protein
MSWAAIVEEEKCHSERASAAEESSWVRKIPQSLRSIGMTARARNDGALRNDGARSQ